MSQNPEWLKKAYFYHVDEPLSMEALNQVNQEGALFAEYFPGYHYIVPIHYDMALDPESKTDFFEYVSEYVNSWCPHTFFYNTLADYKRNPALTYRVGGMIEKNLGTFPERMAKHQAEGDDVWWYVTRYPQSPEITVSIETQALRYRILFWQQKLYNVDNFLYYLVNDWFPGTDAEGKPDFGWNSKHETATGTTPYDIYGNGVLLYVAMESRKTAILGDEGVNAVVPPDFWNGIIQKAVGRFANGEYAEGIGEAVTAVGEVLKQHFPYRDDDINELPDEISFGDDD